MNLCPVLGQEASYLLVVGRRGGVVLALLSLDVVHLRPLRERMNAVRQTSDASLLAERPVRLVVQGAAAASGGPRRRLV